MDEKFTEMDAMNMAFTAYWLGVTHGTLGPEHWEAFLNNPSPDPSEFANLAEMQSFAKRSFPLLANSLWGISYPQQKCEFGRIEADNDNENT